MIDFKNIKSLNIGGKAVKSFFIDGKLAWRNTPPAPQIDKLRFTKTYGTYYDFDNITDLQFRNIIGTEILSPYNTFFSDKSELAEIYDGSGKVTSIGRRSLYEVQNLTYIYTPNVTTIDDAACWGCSNLKTVYLPSLTHSINNQFTACTSIEELYFIDKNSGKQINKVISLYRSTFKEMRNVKVYVPKNLESSFKSDSRWKTLINSYGFQIIGVD